MNEKERQRSLIAQSFYLKLLEIAGPAALADKTLRQNLRVSAIAEADMFIAGLEATYNGK